MSVELHFNNQIHNVEPGKSLFDYAESFEIRVPTSCEKQGKCKECLVEIVEGIEHLSNRVHQENHLRNNFRLSCRSKIIADKGTVRCNTMRRGKLRIESKAFQLPVSNQKLRLEPAITRQDEGVFLDGKEIDKSDKGIYGIAMDLGTTTVVLRLINLETGEIVADSSFENPQRFGGSDVMSRIRYDTDHGGKLLQRTLVGYLNHAIEEFPVDLSTIYEAVVAGNSTMRDLFFRQNVYSIGQNPYRSITELEMSEGKRKSTSLYQSSTKLKLNINPRGRVYGLPIISGHVGADAAACMLAVDIANEEKLIAIMDIGTNTELILGNKNKILAASCPAGPAFEGGNVSCGMPGLSGAIEKVNINDLGNIEIQVIDDSVPEGICGSGYIDILSELIRTGRVNYLGRLENEEKEFLLYSNEDVAISISEKDINELAQAKAANVAGLRTIFDTFGIQFQNIDVFYIAGGFGRYLNIDSSKRIGLIPHIDNSKILQIGNASIEGASIALLSLSKRMELEEIVKRVVHCRLETDPSFFNYFVDGCQFNPIESKYHS